MKIAPFDVLPSTLRNIDAYFFCYYFLFHHVKCLVCASSLRFAIERFSHSLFCVEHYLLQSISNNEELRTLVIASLML